MKSLQHILTKVYAEPWLILPDAHRAIQESIELHLAGSVKLDGVGSSGGINPAPGGENTAPYTAIGSVGVIEVSGILGKRLSMLETMCGGYDLRDLHTALNAAVADPNVFHILLDWDSPGGVITGVPEAASAVRSADERKPVYSFTEMQCCSAALWIASQARGFFATQSAAVGSIGCYAVYLDRSRQIEDMGVKVNAISAGKYKLTGAPFKRMTDDERAILQSNADSIHAEFKAAVKSRRPDMPDDMMEGQVFNGKQAVDIWLTDEMPAGLDDTLRLIRGMRR